MRKEKLAGYVGLGLFSLFPLLGAFQADPTDAGWQEAASRARRSVLAVQMRPDSTNSSRTVGCAVLLSGAPLRAVVAGTLPERPLCTGQAEDRIDWRAAYSDPQGEFTILEGPGATRLAASPAGASFLAGMVPLDPATVGDLGPVGESMQTVDAVLVSPADLATPLWIGELRYERSAAGRPVYAGERMRPLRDAGDTATVNTGSDVGTSSRFTIDPALRGAPFVTREGVVLGLYVGQREGRPRAVPMALVREALAGLDRRAAR